jgi:iron-sulfur cluster repair protein YtfE (RIC family)
MRELERAPERLSELSSELGRVTTELDAALSTHLASEESIVFPAIRSELSAEEQAAIRTELSARRS